MLSIQNAKRLIELEVQVNQQNVKINELTKRVDRLMEVVSGANGKEDWK